MLQYFLFWEDSDSGNDFMAIGIYEDPAGSGFDISARLLFFGDPDPAFFLL